MKKREEYKEESVAQLTLTVSFGSATGGTSNHSDKNGENYSMQSSTEAAETVQLPPRSPMNNLDHANTTSVQRDPTYISSDHTNPGTVLRQPVLHHLPSVASPRSYEHYSSGYTPAAVTPQMLRMSWQYPSGNILGTQCDSGLSYCDPYLSSVGRYENLSNNQPVESGGESPCIRSASEFNADFMYYDMLTRKKGLELREEERGGSCRVHLEILKGRNMPWLEVPDGTLVPPNCYVRTTVGSIDVLTNVCLESDIPVWNFATDVYLPHSQLNQVSIIVCSFFLFFLYKYAISHINQGG